MINTWLLLMGKGMSKVAFVVNKKQKRFFEKIKNYCNIEIKESSKLLIPSFKAIKYIKKVDFKNAIDLRVKDFYAKGKKAPIFLVKTYYTLLAYIYFFRFFNLKKYDEFLIWNGFFLRQAVVIEIAKLFNKEVIYFESGFFGKFVIDKKGVNFLNSVPRDKSFYLNYKNKKDLPNKLIPRNPKNAKKFLNAPKKPLPKKFIFVPFQVDYDTQILLFSPWIKSMEELFNILSEIAKSLKIHIIFKEHPSSKKDYPNLHKKAKKLEYVDFANAYPTQELIEKSEAVITINSSVGVESLLFNKKVITLGNAFYNIEGIVKNAKNKEELIEILKNLDSWEIDKNLIQNFLKYLYYEYLVDIENPDEVKRKIDCK